MAKQNNNNRRGEVRRKALSPEVARRMGLKVQETEVEQKGSVNPKVLYGRNFTRSELEAMSDNDLVKVITNTSQARIHLEAMGIACRRSSMSEHPLVVAHNSKGREARREIQMKRQEFNMSMGFPAYLKKSWFEVRIGLWTGRLFTTQEEVIGQAVMRCAQEGGVTTGSIRIIQMDSSSQYLPN